VVQAVDYCERAVLHFSAPCRTLPSGSNSTRVTDFSGYVQNCTLPDASSVLDVAGRWSDHSVILPQAGFNCSCPCGADTLTALGSIDILLRAIDTGPNYKQLAPRCTSAAPVYQGDLYVAKCSSAANSGVQV
jgi:hypothetical protein